MLLPQITVLSVVGFLFLLVAGFVDWRTFSPLPNKTVNAVASTLRNAVTKTRLSEPTSGYISLPARTAISDGVSKPTPTSAPNATATVQPSRTLLRVGGTIWDDSDRDGIRDRTEHGVQDLLVDLYTPKFEWVAGTESDANGDYFFDVAPGEYVVVIEIPPVYRSTLDSEDTYHPEGWIDDRDNGLGVKGAVITSHPFRLIPDAAAEHTIDFGLQEVAIKRK